MKLGEYLATGNPIVASNIPAHTYWLKEAPISFFEAGDHFSLSEKISESLSAEHQKIESAARRARGEEFSLDTRIRKILSMVDFY
jgi:glycosyltransferase involved in cell wall biosynthesis